SSLYPAHPTHAVWLWKSSSYPSSLTSSAKSAASGRLLKRAHLLCWRLRVLVAASHLDPFEQPASSSPVVLAYRQPMRCAAGGILLRSILRRVWMSGSRQRALAALMVVGLAGCTGASGGTMWRENPGASAAPDLARFNT